LAKAARNRLHHKEHRYTMFVSRASLSSLLTFAMVAAVATATVPPAGAAADACALVTVAEASAAMGAPSLPGKPRPTRHGSSCRYYSANHQMNVFVQTVQPGDMIGAQQLGGKAVPGVGDKAIWASGSLFVQKGGNVAQIGLYRSAASMEHMDPQIVTLGKSAAGRM
jgi:hypothetical protein